MRQVEIRIRPGKELHPNLIHQLLLAALRHAAYKPDNHALPLAAERVEKLDALAHLVLGILAHRACVDHNNLRTGHFVRKFVARHAQY